MSTAMDSFAPFDGQTVNEDQWRGMQRRITVAGVVRNQAGELSCFGNSTGMFVQVNSGEVQIESHWGQVTSQKSLPVTSNATGSTRLDLVVARADFTANTVELDVLVGTTVTPSVTRNSAKWEIPLAVVSVTNGAVTIAAADVKDARQWGGPPVATVSDDFLLFKDKISSTGRYSVTTENAVTNGFLYVARMHSLGDQSVGTVRLCPSVLPVGGTTTVRIFRGFRQDRLTTFIDPTTSTFLYGGGAGVVHESGFPTAALRAGETIVVAVLGLATSTAATLATTAVTLTSGATAFLNPDSLSTVTTALKGGVASMPTTLNLLDGTWTLRDRVFWSALS